VSGVYVVNTHRHGRARPASPAWRAGIFAAISFGIFFFSVADILAAHGYTAAHDPTLWSASNPSGAAGRWIELALIGAIRLIPGSTSQALSILTVICGALFQGVFTHNLVKRGWQPAQAALAAGLNALHPVMLSLVTSGSASLLYVMMAASVVIALDRFEAIGDTQSLIVLGLLLAILGLAWPDAIFFMIPLAALLPWAFKDIRSYSAATALFVIALTPALICLSAVALGGTLFQVPFGDVFAIWAAPLHGAGHAVVSHSFWLATYGGYPFAAFIVLCVLCACLVPMLLVVVLRFATARRERANPVTGVAALVLPPVTGAIATMYYQLESPWIVIALSLSCVLAWAATTSFRALEKWALIAMMFAGVVTAWATPLLWQDPAHLIWRGILLGGS